MLSDLITWLVQYSRHDVHSDRLIVGHYSLVKPTGRLQACKNKQNVIKADSCLGVRLINSPFSTLLSGSVFHSP